MGGGKKEGRGVDLNENIMKFFCLFCFILFLFVCFVYSYFL